MDDVPAPPPISEATAQPPTIRHRRAGLGLPIVLFVATCISTYLTGGLLFAVTLMVTLLAHEFGHFLQAVRYGVPASLPLFIPMPISPIGTMGAVIVMQPGKGDRRAIFDIAITGPLAGLVFALIFSIVGLELSHVMPTNQAGTHELGEPLLFKLLGYLIFGPLDPGKDVYLHPIAFAGWVGIFITALNLIPIGQLDGGHILYALLRKKAHIVAQGLLLAAVAAVVLGKYWGWSLMLLLLLLIGPIHPPTANDDVPLGTTRTVLGWLTLPFVFIGFTPTPFIG
jgi:membrane-associated protease RseP (regulator of RpoE activity)